MMEPPEAVYNRGLSLLGARRPDEALACFDQILAAHPHVVEVLSARALAVKPDHVEALNNRGHALHQLGRADEAMTSFLQALAIRPDFAEASNNLGLALEALGRSDDALARYDEALAIRPDYVDALMNRGNCLMVMYRYEEAQSSYRRVRALEPQNAKARFAICTAQLPVLYDNDEEIDRQRARFEQHLTQLCDDVERRAVSDLAEGFGSHLPFYLPYQGRNDRHLQTIHGSLAYRLVAQRSCGEVFLLSAQELRRPPAAG